MIQHMKLDAEEGSTLESTLTEMVRSGLIVKKSFTYGLPKTFGLFAGRLSLTSKGAGYVVLDQKNHEDVFVALEHLNGAVDGDKVLVSISKSSLSRPTGKIASILCRSKKRIIGQFQFINNGFGYVVPDNKKLMSQIFIRTLPSTILKNGDKVAVELLKSTGWHTVEGQIVHVLGEAEQKDLPILTILAKHDLSTSFPEPVLSESTNISPVITDQERAARRDLCHDTIITIDGEDAKDLDDAVSVEELPDQHIRLGVHIADVSHYIASNSALDQEAYKRGCSVYLVDRVLPMLPKNLSNNICSLNPSVERLTLTCEMQINTDGNVIVANFYPSIIKTTARMSYTDVTKLLLAQDEELANKYIELLPHLKLMAKLAKRLRTQRIKRGAIDFNFSEAKIIVDKTGKPINIFKKPRTISERLIEEFMLVANETVASFLHKKNKPTIYRIHERPDEEKLRLLAQVSSACGYSIKGKLDKVKPKILQQLLGQIKNSSKEPIISKLILKAMQQARYDTKPIGHFGLATPLYTHFTSPIRRYPDLIIHRLLREALQEKHTENEVNENTKLATLKKAALHASACERAAVEAEREVSNLKMTEYMVDKIEETYSGIISGITSFGLFVELENMVEGLVHVRQLKGDYFYYDEQQYALIGRHSRRIMQIGDKVKIKVLAINLEEQKIDFELLKHIDTSKKKSYKSKNIRKKIRKKKVKKLIKPK
ncbi:MAG: ribonuclease, partial [Bacillota bacterium]